MDVFIHGDDISRNRNIFIGLLLIIVTIWCIRNQTLVTETQYKFGMIPHHSMAIHMSKKLLERLNSADDNKQSFEKGNKIAPFVNNVIKNQEEEILFLKMGN